MYKKDLEKSEILQGDIFQNFTYIRWADEENDEVKIPFFVVLTQACDLEQDFKERDKEKYEKRDKYLPSLLICPAYIAMLVKEGKHLEQDNLLREQYPDKPRWNAIISNNHARYHFLKSDTSIGLPELIIDFKHYYTIPTYVLYKGYKKHYVGSINVLFREGLSQRFAFYLSRIGLPDIEEKAPIPD